MSKDEIKGLRLWLFDVLVISLFFCITVGRPRSVCTISVVQNSSTPSFASGLRWLSTAPLLSTQAATWGHEFSLMSDLPRAHLPTSHPPSISLISTMHREPPHLNAQLRSDFTPVITSNPHIPLPPTNTHRNQRAKHQNPLRASPPKTSTSTSQINPSCHPPLKYYPHGYKIITSSHKAYPLPHPQPPNPDLRATHYLQENLWSSLTSRCG